MGSWIVGHVGGIMLCLFLGFVDYHSDNLESYFKDVYLGFLNIILSISECRKYFLVT